MSSPDTTDSTQSHNSVEARAARTRANGELEAPSLAALALQVYESDVRARRLEAEREAALSDDLRTQFMAQLYADNIDLLRSLVPQRLELPEDSTVLGKLDWRIDEERFKNVTFSRDGDGEIRSNSNTPTTVVMRTTVDGMPLTATFSHSSTGTSSVHLNAETNMGNVTIMSLTELGKELEQFKRW